MDDSKFVIIGANGQLGKALQAQYPSAKGVDADTLDIADPKSVEAFDWSDVTHILNAAAYTNVDGAETAEGRIIAWQVNAKGAGNLSYIARKHEITLVHISTDYVFDGTKDNHTEYEAYSPLSVYGASKTAGDMLVEMSHRHYLVRTSWVIGDGQNFVNTMIGLAEKNISPTVVNDQIGRLTFTSELVRAIDHILSNNLTFGTYNLSNDGQPASWADITREIFSLLGRDDLSVTDISTEDYYKGKENIAPRPLKSTLDLNKIQNTGFKSIDWKTDLSKYMGGDAK